MEDNNKSFFEEHVEEILDSYRFVDGFELTKKQLRDGIKVFDADISRIVFSYVNICSYHNCNDAINTIIQNIFKIPDNKVNKLKTHSSLYKKIQAFVDKDDKLAIEYLKSYDVELPPKEKIPTYLKVLSDLAKKCLRFNFNDFKLEMFEKSWKLDPKFQKTCVSECYQYLKSYKPNPSYPKTKTLS